ncbi:unnamed protein product [Sphagnum jensenii]|uniref:Uncharacterized protein n=1 Tax=Sphagnum jensenii TaxID=128206 RepID=A0ABP0XB16_9BRYO
MWDVWSCTVVSFVEYNATQYLQRDCVRQKERKKKKKVVFGEKKTPEIGIWNSPGAAAGSWGIQHYRMCIYCLNERKQVLGYLVMRIMCTITM